MSSLIVTNRAVMVRIAIHIQDESRNRGVHERCVQQIRQPPGQLESAGVPCDVSLEIPGMQSQSLQRPWHPVRRVIAHEYERPAAVRIDNGHGLTAEPGGRFQHVGAILRLGNNYTNTAGPRRIIPVPFRLSAVNSFFDGF